MPAKKTAKASLPTSAQLQNVFLSNPEVSKGMLAATMTLANPAHRPLFLVKCTSTAVGFPVSLRTGKDSYVKSEGCPHIRPLQPKVDDQLEELQSLTAQVSIDIMDKNLEVLTNHMSHSSKYSYQIGCFCQRYSMELSPPEDISTALS